MAFTTLTTDFGLKDHFVGAVKGAIYSELPEANIVDITHEITPFNIAETAYILQNAYKSFPKGTIHIISVNSDGFFTASEDMATFEELKKVKTNIARHIIDSVHGHDAFLIEFDQLGELLSDVF